MKITLTIRKNDAGQRLDKFLTKTYPNIKEYMLKALQNKDQYGLWDKKLAGLDDVATPGGKKESEE